MKRDPVEIVDEYIHHEAPQVRKNAVIALGVIQSERSVECLVRKALGDVDLEVRLAAESELLGLSEQSEGFAAKVLQAEFEDPKKRKLVYALLGRLKLAGKNFVVPGKGAIAWIRSAGYLFRQVYPVKTLSAHIRRSIIPALLGGAISVALILMYISGLAAASTLRGIDSDLSSNILTAGIVGLVIALVVSFRSMAFNLHYKSGVGAFVEIGRVALFFMICSLVSGVYMVLQNEIGFQLIGILLLLPAYAGAVRALTIVASGLTSIKTLNLMFESIVGSAAGILCLTLGAWSIFAGESEASTTWYTLLPSTIAMAVTFAAIDAAASLKTARRNIPRIVMSIAISALVYIPALLSVLIPTIEERILGSAHTLYKTTIQNGENSHDELLKELPCVVSIGAESGEERDITIQIYREEDDETPSQEASDDSIEKSEQDATGNVRTRRLAMLLLNKRGKITDIHEADLRQPVSASISKTRHIRVIVYNPRRLSIEEFVDDDNTLQILSSSLRALFSNNIEGQSKRQLRNGFHLKIDVLEKELQDDD